jgi:replicative DNA helicase
MSSFNGNGKHATALVQPQYDLNVLPPHDEQAEEAVLGSIFLDPEIAIEVTAKLKPEAFYVTRNRDIYAAVYSLTERHEPVDYLTVTQEMRRAGNVQPDAEIHMNELVDFTNRIATSLNIGSYIRAVNGMHTRRKMLAAATATVKHAYDFKRKEDDCVADAGRAFLEVQQDLAAGTTTTARNAVGELMAHVEAMYARPDKSAVIGLPSGFTDLDKMTGGLQKGDLFIVAGRPGMGKSALMKDLAVTVCKAGKRVMFFSLEMSNEQVMTRIIAGESGIDSNRLKIGDLRDDEWTNFSKTSVRVGDWHLFLDDAAALTIPALRAKINRVYQQHGLDLVCVDYLQLMKGNAENRVQELGEITMGLKQIAREFKVPLVAGAQLSRALEQRNDKRPQLSDLRESGSIENDADIVSFIYRDEIYNPGTDAKNIAEILIGKNRNGPTGYTNLFFDKRLTAFKPLHRERVEL